MRASTLFALTACILIGLAVAIGVRMSGIFNKPVETLAKRPDVQILVAARNLFPDDTIDNTGVRVRPLRAEEFEEWNRNKDQYLPPVPAAAQLRMANANIEADTPIKKSMLKPMVKPDALNLRLLPDMRAVNISLPKERSAGGLIQVGEWVEVYLTSAIDGRDGSTFTRTAAIAPKVRVIAKRDTLWPIFSPLPKDKPVEYTLEVNSYRAALIEFSRNKGVFSMTPLPQVEQRKLEAGRAEKLAAAKGDPKAPIESAPEGQEEDQLVQGVERGELIVSDQDLVLLFNIKEESSPPPPAMVTIERFSGTRRVEPASFTLDGQRSIPVSGRDDGRGPIGRSWNHWPAGYNAINRTTFGPYDTLGTNRINGAGMGGWKFNTPDCPTCKKNKY